MFWISDPKTKESSTSVTLVVVSFAVAIIAIGLEISGVTHTLSGSMELFYACMANYFGKRWVSSKGATVEEQK